MCLIIQTWLGVHLKMLPLVCILNSFYFKFLLLLSENLCKLLKLSSAVNIVLPSAAYLGALEKPEITELLLSEYRSATNMTEQFAALVAIEQQPGQVRDEVLADFYNKWQHNFLVRGNLWILLSSFGNFFSYINYVLLSG